MSTGSEAFRFFICLETAKFVLLWVFTPIDMIFRENVVNTTSQECKSPLAVDMRRSKKQGQCQPRFQVSIQLVPSEQGEVGVDLELRTVLF